MKPSETKRRQSVAMFHRNPFWHHAGVHGQDREKDHSPLSLQKLEEGFFWVMGMPGRGRRHSVSEGSAAPRSFVRRLSTSEVRPSLLVKVVLSRVPHLLKSYAARKLPSFAVKTPSSDSYDGTGDKAASEFASFCPDPSIIAKYTVY